jgi:uncharacterized damage-inducible protein DinB
MTTQEHWLEKAKDLSPRVALWYSQMEEQRKRLLEIVAEIDAEILDDTPDERKIETIGTLLLHIAAVEQLKGKPKQFFLERLAEVRAEVYQRLRHLADHDLEKSVGTGDDKFSIEWIFFHILEHEAMHIGQINLLARLSKLAERR